MSRREEQDNTWNGEEKVEAEKGEEEEKEEEEEEDTKPGLPVLPARLPWQPSGGLGQWIYCVDNRGRGSRPSRFLLWGEE